MVAKGAVRLIVVVAMAAVGLTVSAPARASGEIDAKYAQPGIATLLGAPKDLERNACKGSSGGGRMRVYANGRIYYSPGTGAHEVHGDILRRLLDFNAVCNNDLGFPTSDEQAGDFGTRFNTFEHGAIYFQFSPPAHVVHGAIYDQFIAKGGLIGVGPPQSDDLASSGTKNHKQVFEFGNIYNSTATGAHFIPNGAILDKYKALHEFSRVGFPSGNLINIDSYCGPNAGTVQFFEHGGIYSSPPAGTHFLNGAIGTHFEDIGGVCNWGRPTTDVIHPRVGNAFALFDGPPKGSEVSAIVDRTTPGHPAAGSVQGAIFQKILNDAGGPSSDFQERALRALASYGPPIGDEAPTPCAGSSGGRYSRFRFRDVVWSSGTGAHILVDANGDAQRFRTKWESMTADCSVLGLPTTDQLGPGNHVLYTDFQHGTLVYNGARTVEVHGKVWDLWNANGRNDYIGWPLTDVTDGPLGGYFTHFTQGSIYFRPIYTDATALFGAHDNRYRGAFGGPAGVLGYPLFGNVPQSDGQLYGGAAGPDNPYNGVISTFEHGFIAGNRFTFPAVGMTNVPIYTKWHNEFGTDEHRESGYPIGDTITDHDGVTFQLFHTLHRPVGTDSDTMFVVNPHNHNVYKLDFQLLDCYRRGPFVNGPGLWDSPMGFPTSDEFESGVITDEDSFEHDSYANFEHNPDGAGTGRIYYHDGRCHYLNGP